MEQMAQRQVFFTIGYEGREADVFVEDLVGSGVQVLVDVRELAHSRKHGFSKSTLSSLVEEAGIEYLHFRSLGSPRDSRKRLRESGDFETFFSEYARHLRANFDELCALLEVIISGKRPAIMCFERDHTQCHRSCLVSALYEEAGSNLAVYHL